VEINQIIMKKIKNFVDIKSSSETHLKYLEKALEGFGAVGQNCFTVGLGISLDDYKIIE
jgi:hypothetical protein